MASINDRPLIGINTDYRAAAKGRATHSFIASGYYDILLTAGALPIILPPFTKEADLLPILEKLDGVMLTGGDDLDPRKMGQTPHPSITLMNDRRESADRLLCKHVQAMRVPTLGIGVGMQELNVVNGGVLYLHLAEELPKSIPHRDPQGGVHRHTVIMDPGSRMEEIYGPGEIRVNSYHHMGIRKLAPNFRQAALAPDGLIEAFEGRDPSWWVTGIQWHPEAEGTVSLDTQLIEAFVEAAASCKRSLRLAKVG
jgi:putative glutamine amidotransferase